jgi:hypothetical protein
MGKKVMIENENIREKLLEVIKAVKLCIEERMITPSLILLYAGIEAVAWLDCGDSLRSKIRFTHWVKNYVLPLEDSDVTADELYGARCGLIHTLSAESEMSRKKKARQVVYAWGSSDVSTLKKMIDIGNMTGYVAVKVETLVNNSKIGIERFLGECTKEPEKAKAIQERAKKLFRHMSKSEAQKLIEWGDSMLKR